jgi:hypothetical protein
LAAVLGGQLLPISLARVCNEAAQLGVTLRAACPAENRSSRYSFPIRSTRDPSQGLLPILIATSTPRIVVQELSLSSTENREPLSGGNCE